MVHGVQMESRTPSHPPWKNVPNEQEEHAVHTPLNPKVCTGQVDTQVELIKKVPEGHLVHVVAVVAHSEQLDEQDSHRCERLKVPGGQAATHVEPISEKPDTHDVH